MRFTSLSQSCHFLLLIFFWAFDSSKNVMRLLIISYIFLGGGSLFGGGGASNAPTFGSVASQPAGGTFGAIAQQGKI